MSEDQKKQLEADEFQEWKNSYHQVLGISVNENWPDSYSAWYRYIGGNPQVPVPPPPPPK
jgi:hypothetical protein